MITISYVTRRGAHIMRYVDDPEIARKIILNLYQARIECKAMWGPDNDEVFGGVFRRHEDNKLCWYYWNDD